MAKRKSKESTKQKISIFSWIVFAILIIVSAITGSIVLSMKIVPAKYIIPLGIVYILILIGIGFVIFQKKFKNWLKILMSVISIIFIAGLSFGLYYLNSTLHFMNEIRSKDYQIEEYYVMVLNNSEYKKLKDLEDQTLGTYKSITDHYSDALDKLSSKVRTEEKEYDSYIEASQALMDGKVEAILLSAAYKSIVDDEIENFDTKTRILDTIQIRIKNEVETKEADVTNESFNIYISGIDIYGDISLVSRSDVNMIITVNPKTHQVLLTSIPRDYYVQLHGTAGYRDKLTHAGIYGIDMSVQTLEDLFGIDINYYVRVNFTTLINLVDAIGGIDVFSDATFTSYTNNTCKFQYGTNHLGGKCALAFSRERYAYKEGDRHRIQNQQDVLKAILNKALSSKTLITKYTSILESLGSSFQTSVPTSKIYELVNMQLDSMPNWNIEQISVNGSDKHDYTYSYSAQKLYVMEPDMSTVHTAQQKIAEVMKGE